MTLIIGLTGMRGVGKSEVAMILADKGYHRTHAFDGGKAATAAYFMHLGADETAAASMIYGSLKDEPSAILPGCATPRFFMEKFGRFMGTELGPDWTLGAELDRIQRQFPGEPIVAESLVYEATCLRSRGGIVIRVSRPDHEGPIGVETDRVQREIVADHTIINDGSLEDLERKVDAVLVGIRSRQP